MKITISDKFLWDVYKMLEKTGDVVDFMLSDTYRKVHLMHAAKNPVFGKYKKEMGRKKFDKMIYYLKQKNYIRAKSLGGNHAMMLTKEGFSKVFKASFGLEVKEKRKDGKWIMLTFDIPQKHSKARALLRSILKNLEYKMFQQSIWVNPYDVSEKTEKLLQMYNLEKYVKVFLIEEL